MSPCNLSVYISTVRDIQVIAGEVADEIYLFFNLFICPAAAAMDQVEFERRSDRTQNFDAIRAYIPVKNQNGTHQEIGLVTFSNNCVLGVHVQPAYRKQGLGAELMAQAVDAIERSRACARNMVCFRHDCLLSAHGSEINGTSHTDSSRLAP